LDTQTVFPPFLNARLLDLAMKIDRNAEQSSFEAGGSARMSPLHHSVLKNLNPQELAGNTSCKTFSDTNKPEKIKKMEDWALGLGVEESICFFNK
jgi:hypothetical protein